MFAQIVSNMLSIEGKRNLHIGRIPFLLYYEVLSLIGPQHEKTCLRGLRTTRAQTSLLIRAV